MDYLLAFTAGILSFTSACILPLIPSYLAVITGLSVTEF
ncbi:cytochrome c biogenesis protein CcdA [Anaerobacillus arseniciselenatis]|nr:cytochrome c biogenesis protein CcdA [Anaerobacillus arseniciselenatis]